MHLSTKYILSGLLIIFTTGCSTNSNLRNDPKATIDLGDPDSEKAHNVEAQNAEKVSYKYPELWVMASRASAYDQGHEPYHVVDGNAETYWQVTGTPPHPIGGGHWLDLELNHTAYIGKISIRWHGEQRYQFKIYNQRFSDQVNNAKIFEGESNGNSETLETYHFGDSIKLRSLRIEISRQKGAEKTVPRGIREVRIGDLPWPDGYPQATHARSQVVKIQRPFYVEFERFMDSWPQFNLRRPLADGSSARQILNTGEFEGGHLDFDIAVAPEKQNWITLKIWESNPELMTEHGNTIALEAFAEDPNRNRRWFVPEFITEPPNRNYEWYGDKPRPGRWVYANYRLPRDITMGKTQVQLRLQGIGNDRRDHPMRAPAPPVYRIHSHTAPVFGKDRQSGNE